MLFGGHMMQADFAIRPDDLAKLLEERGFESVWFGDHTHIPASRRTPYGLGPELPKEYWHVFDPFVAATAAAAATTNLKVGMGVLLIIERDPIVTAKQVASIDVLSGGRFILGIGAGWNAEEMENHGTPFDKRFAVMRERVQAMKAIWTEEEAEYHGAHVNFDKIWCDPKPLQKPHPPIMLGGRGPHVFQRVAAYGDAWGPVVPDADQEGTIFAEQIAALRQTVQAAGRDPNSVSVTVFNARSEPAVIERLEAAGVQRMVFPVPAAGRDIVEPHLDRLAKLI